MGLGGGGREINLELGMLDSVHTLMLQPPYVSLNLEGVSGGARLLKRISRLVVIKERLWDLESQQSAWH